MRWWEINVEKVVGIICSQRFFLSWNKGEKKRPRIQWTLSAYSKMSYINITSRVPNELADAIDRICHSLSIPTVEPTKNVLHRRQYKRTYSLRVASNASFLLLPYVIIVIGIKHLIFPLYCMCLFGQCNFSENIIAN